MDFSTGPQIGAVIPHKSDVTSLSYHGDGVHLFAATQADSRLYLINSLTGKCEPSTVGFKCEREGISRVSRTHHDHCVLFTSGGSSGGTSVGTSNSSSIHYWSLYDNKILRKFRGHSDVITDLCMSPAEDMFLSASRDRTVRLWNVQQAGCVGKMDLKQPDSATKTAGDPHAVFDSTGMVFAVMSEMAGGQGHYIHLYDARNYSGGAFSELKVLAKDIQAAMTTHRIQTQGSSPSKWNSLEFNQSGNQILVQADDVAIVLDGYEGTVQRIFQSQGSTGHGSCVSCFTPDDQFVIMGTHGGTLDVWNAQSGTLAKQLTGHLGPVGAVACNPKYSQIASGCTNTCLWIW